MNVRKGLRRKWERKQGWEKGNGGNEGDQNELYMHMKLSKNKFNC